MRARRERRVVAKHAYMRTRQSAVDDYFCTLSQTVRHSGGGESVPNSASQNVKPNATDGLEIRSGFTRRLRRSCAINSESRRRRSRSRYPVVRGEDDARAYN